MKRILLIGAMAAALGFVGSSKAEAALVGSFHVCQGATCVDFAGDSFGGVAGTVVGDYTVRGTGAHTENAGFSETSNANIQIQRTGTSSATALDVWYTVTGYTLPAGANYVMTTTGTASKTGTTSDAVSFSAWYSSTNSTGFPTGVLGGSGSCTPAPSVTIASTSCSGSQGPTPVGASSPLYSLITRTTFSIGLADASLFSSTGQADITAVAAVPEPGSMILLGTGLLGMATVIRRRIVKK